MNVKSKKSETGVLNFKKVKKKKKNNATCR